MAGASAESHLLYFALMMQYSILLNPILFYSTTHLPTVLVLSWQVTSLTRKNGFATYTRTRCKAEAGEKEKRGSWDEAIKRRQDIAAARVSVIPFSIALCYMCHI